MCPELVLMGVALCQEPLVALGSDGLVRVSSRALCPEELFVPSWAQREHIVALCKRGLLASLPAEEQPEHTHRQKGSLGT